MARMTAEPEPDAEPRTTIVLRDMTRRDIRAVRRIESAAYRDAWPARVFETELANAFARYRVAVERPAEAAPRRGPVAALRRHLGRKRIVGFSGVWYMVDQLHLVTIATAPAEQGRGIGQRLLLDCLDLARAADLATVVLEMRVSNHRARALYERFGFRRKGTLKAYYQDNDEDADVMISGVLDDAATRAHIEALRAEHRLHYGALSAE
ncbi:MAG: ribosomal-protein-alanine N-acetyltransferase [Dehalococcoidia bacterium]|nr:ribosomal-protein-alanine N-acetyltransferase [Dehalococcoidia bacterium]